MSRNTQILQFKCKNVDEMRVKRAAKCAMTVHQKCRNYKICAKRAKNKVKPSNIENMREKLSFLCLKLFKMVKNTFSIVRKICNDGKDEV